MLKFEGKFKVGDTIKAFDFEPCDDRPPSYMIGTVTNIKADFQGVQAYVIELDSHIMSGREGIESYGDDKTAYVPHQVGFFEHDERITKVG